jgi:hypothetical protein
VGHSAESKRSPFPSIARVEVADGAGDPQALRVTVCVLKSSRGQQIVGGPQSWDFWQKSIAFPVQKCSMFRRYLPHPSIQKAG